MFREFVRQLFITLAFYLPSLFVAVVVLPKLDLALFVTVYYFGTWLGELIRKAGVWAYRRVRQRGPVRELKSG